MRRVRQCGHVHRIRVIAQMDDVRCRGRTLQFAPKENKLIRVAQPLEERRTLHNPRSKHRRRLQQADLMPTVAQPVFQH